MNQAPPRRSMDDALNVPREALAIIQAGTPKPQTQASLPPAVSAAKPQEKPSPSPAAEVKISAAVTQPSKKPEKDATPEAPALASVNFRVPANIPPALLKASSERKMKKIRPFTQQDIVAEALMNWLQKNGYLK